MRIADTDGCEADFTSSCFLPVTNAFYGTNFTIADVTDWDFEKCLGISHEQAERVWTSDELVEAYCYADAFQMGLDFVNEAMEKGEEVLHITARGLPIPGMRGMEDYGYLQRVRENTNFWFTQQPMPAIGIFYSLDKLGPIQAFHQIFGITEILEDSPTTALKLAKAGFKVIMPVWPYNAHVFHENITRIENWR